MPMRNKKRDNPGHRPKTYVNTKYWRSRFFLLTKNKNIAKLFQSVETERYETDLIRVSKRSTKYQPF